VVNILHSIRVKLLARRLAILLVGFTPERLTLGLGPRCGQLGLTGAWLTRYLGRPRNRYRLTPDMQLTRTVTAAEWEAGLATVKAALTELRSALEPSRPASTGSTSPLT
jgi:hypothetical protein